MYQKTKAGFSSKRLAENAKHQDVIDRARTVSNSAIGQATDRLGTPGIGKDRL